MKKYGVFAFRSRGETSMMYFDTQEEADSFVDFITNMEDIPRHNMIIKQFKI